EIDRRMLRALLDAGAAEPAPHEQTTDMLPSVFRAVDDPEAVAKLREAWASGDADRIAHAPFWACRRSLEDELRAWRGAAYLDSSDRLMGEYAALIEMAQ